MSAPQRSTYFLGVLCLFGTLAACSNVIGGYSNVDGEDLARSVEAAAPGIVQSAVYRPGDLLDPPEVLVTLNPNARDADALWVWCQLLEPAIPADGSRTLGATMWTFDGPPIHQPDSC